MAESHDKPIENVTINYKDGTHDTLQFYSVVGLAGDTWVSLLLSPPQTTSKLKMNNMLVELSNDLIISIDRDL
jgi:hypothetical protein